MKFCTVTLGCKVNQFETQAIESVLVSRGHTLQKPGGGCDVCVINTCTVTAESARKSRQAVRHAKKLEPGALIAVCGCFSQLEPITAKSIGADLVGGTGDRQGFALEVEKLAGAGTRTHAGAHTQAGAMELSMPRRTRGLLKIQDGCDNYCAYCIVPYARGGSRSLALQAAAEHARTLGESGYREIVITGIEISSYGKDLPGNPSLTDVVREIGKSAPDARLRLGSLDPGAMTEDLCRELQTIENLCCHFHLSLQSGCDETLRRMGRKYDTREVLSAIIRLRSCFPDCGVTADLITGFPEETEREFEQTLTFIKTAAFSGMHVFPYSPRPGTAAAGMPGKVARSVRQERARAASAVAAEMAEDFKRCQTGKTRDVLFERKRDGYWTGHSDNYIEVAVKSGGARNMRHPVRITAVSDGTVWGEIMGLQSSLSGPTPGQAL